MKRHTTHCLTAILFCGCIFFSAMVSNAQNSQSEKFRETSNSSATERGRAESSERKTFSQIYRERFNTQNYRERNSGENFRETQIQEGRRRRREPNSGDISLHFNHARTGVALSPQLREDSRDTFVDLAPPELNQPSIYHSGRGMRLPLPTDQTALPDPQRQERVRSMFQAPSLLQRYTTTLNPSNDEKADDALSDPNDSNLPPRRIPPVNQVNSTSNAAPNLDPQTPPSQQIQPMQAQSGINPNPAPGIHSPQYSTAGPAQNQNRLPAPIRQGTQINSQNSQNNSTRNPNAGGFLPYPLSTLQNRGAQPARPASPHYGLNRGVNRRDPALQPRYQSIQNNPNKPGETKSNPKRSSEKTSDSKKQGQD